MENQQHLTSSITFTPIEQILAFTPAELDDFFGKQWREAIADIAYSTPPGEQVTGGDMNTSNLSALFRQAAAAPTVQAAQRFYDVAGVITHRVEGKAPRRRAWQAAIDSQRVTAADTAIGLLCGSGGVFAVDLDSDDDVNQFAADLPDLYATMRAQGRRGCHLYYAASALPANAAYKHGERGGELRARGMNLVLPPSQHASGACAYRIISDDDIVFLQPADTARLEAWFAAQAGRASAGAPAATRQAVQHAPIMPRPSVHRASKTPRQWVIDAIAREMQAAGATLHTNSRGERWLNMPSPLRHDDHPSFGFCVDTGGLHDFATGRDGSPIITLCRRFNIDIRGKSLFVDDEPVTRTASAGEPADAPAAGHLFSSDLGSDLELTAAPAAAEPASAWFATPTLPDIWKRALNRYLPNHAGMLCEQLHRAVHAGSIDPGGFTRAQLHAALPSVGFKPQSAKVMIDRFNTLAEAGILRQQERGGAGRVYQLTSYADLRAALIAVAAKKINMTEHARAVARLTKAMYADMGIDPADIDFETLSAAYTPAYDDATAAASARAATAVRQLAGELDNHAYTPLPAVPIGKPDEYHAAILRAQVDQRGTTELSYQQIAATVGCAAGGVRKVLALANVNNDSAVETVELRQPDEIYSLQAGSLTGRKCKVMQFAITTRAGEIVAQADTPAAATADFARAHLPDGGKIICRVRTRGRQTAAGDFNPAAVVRTAASAARPAAARPHASILIDQPRQPAAQLGYSREWLANQLVMVGARHSLTEGDTLIDTDSGELVMFTRAEPLAQLARVLVNRSRYIARQPAPVDALAQIIEGLPRVAIRQVKPERLKELGIDDVYEGTDGAGNRGDGTANPCSDDRELTTRAPRRSAGETCAAPFMVAAAAARRAEKDRLAEYAAEQGFPCFAAAFL